MSSIIGSNISKSIIIAGPAGEALAQVVPALQIFMSLLEGEDAPLSNAPPDIKDKTKEIIIEIKDLVSKINAMVGEGILVKKEDTNIKDANDDNKKKAETKTKKINKKKNKD